VRGAGRGPASRLERREESPGGGCPASSFSRRRTCTTTPSLWPATPPGDSPMDWPASQRVQNTALPLLPPPIRSRINTTHQPPAQRRTTGPAGRTTESVEGDGVDFLGEGLQAGTGRPIAGLAGSGVGGLVGLGGDGKSDTPAPACPEFACSSSAPSARLG